MARLRLALAHCGGARPVVLVRSEYRAGQFTDGRLDHPLTHLCVPGRNVDCEWADGLETSGALVITKTEMDAGQASAYRDLIHRSAREGYRQIVLAGFQLTTCVRATALTTARLVDGTGVRVVVADDLVGARASSYLPTPAGSRVDATWQELLAAGIIVARLSSDDRDRIRRSDVPRSVIRLDLQDVGATPGGTRIPSQRQRLRR